MIKTVDDVLRFDEEKHRYFIKGRAALGVTETLALAGVTNFEFVPRDILDRAVNFGRCVHKAVEFFDRGVLDTSSLDEALRPYLLAWEKYKAERVGEIVEIERHLYSLRFGFAGTLDRVFRDKKGNLCLLDIKTSRELSAGTPLQTEAYAMAYEEMTGLKIRRRFGVILQEDGDYYAEEFRDRSDSDDFIACLRVAAFKMRRGIKK